MVVHKCSHCSFESTHKWVVKRHMESQHNVQQEHVAGRHPYVEPSQGFNSVSVYHPQHTMQPLNLPYPAQHPYNPQPVGHLYGQRTVNVQSPAPYTYPNHHHIGGSKRHDDIPSVASTYGSESGTEADTETDTGSEGERNTSSLDQIYDMAYESYSEFIEYCDMARDKVDDWGKLDKKTKQLTLKKYALLKMKMIESINGLSDGEEETESQDAENDQEEDDCEVENEQTECEDGKSGNESSEENREACTCFLWIISGFEDEIGEKYKKRLKLVEEEAAEEIIEEIEEDVEDDDSEVEPEDGESHEEVKLKTQMKDLMKLKAGYKEEGEKYFQHCSNREITTLCRWCYYILTKRYPMNEKLLEKFRQKPFNKNGINNIANVTVPRWDKRKLLQRDGIGEGIMSGFLPLILNTLKSLIQQPY